MGRGKFFNINVINILIAVVIGLFVIFPDVMLMSRLSQRAEMENTSSDERGGQIAFTEPVPPPVFDRKMAPPPQERKLFYLFPFSPFKKLVANYIFYFTLSAGLLYMNTYFLLHSKWKLKRKNIMAVSIGASLFICLLFIMFYTVVDSRRHIFPLDGLNVFKIFFIGLVSFLFVYVIYLIERQHEIVLENERLRSENVLAQYNMLATQVNPHFLFNSLNSLSSLVREDENKKSLKYIDELSDIFRYTLNPNQKGESILKNELDFLNAYMYMMKIRYEGKLHFDIKIDERYLSYHLPMLSLQTLIENVVKHNEISEDKPMTAHICTTGDDMLVISNRIQRKIKPAGQRGIGLENLNSRYRLMFSRSIIVENNGETFTVKLPLIQKNMEA